MSTLVSPASPPALERIGKPAIAVLGLLALALGTLQSVVEPALPLLQDELDVSPAEGALIGNALLITGAVLTPVAGRLGDRYGGKRVLIWLTAVVSTGGLLASVAPNLPVLLLGQILQGVMVGALPLSFILVRKHLSAGESQAAMGLVVALFTAGGMVGTLIAGPLAQNLSWHWIFALPTMAIVISALAVARLMPHDPPLERSVAGPVVRTRLLARPAMWTAGVLTFIVTCSFGMVVFLLPQLFAVSGDGYGFGADTTAIGLFLLPGAIVGALSDSVGGVAARRFGPRFVVGVSAVVTAVTLLALASFHTAQWQLVVAKMLVAFAAGIATTALLAGTATAIPTKDIGIATSLLVVTRVIGVVVGAWWAA